MRTDFAVFFFAIRCSRKLMSGLADIDPLAVTDLVSLFLNGIFKPGLPEAYKNSAGLYKTPVSKVGELYDD